MLRPPFTKAWLENHAILCYRFESLGAEAAEAWFKDVLDAYAHWEPDQPLRLIVDMRETGALLSPEAMQRARQLAQTFPDIDGRIALLVRDLDAAQMLAQFTQKALQPNRERRLFEEEAEAITWLMNAESPS
jgi:hypothetical protein